MNLRKSAVALLIAAGVVACGVALAEVGAGSDAAYDVMVRGMYLKFPDVPQIKPEAALADLDAGSYVVLDIRAAQEHAVSHLKGARLVPYEGFDLSQVADIPKDAPVLVYCSVGYRSSDVGQKMRAAGYTAVVDLYGGLFLWNNLALPLFRGAIQVDQIHPYDGSWGRWITRGTPTRVPLPPTAPGAPAGAEPATKP